MKREQHIAVVARRHDEMFKAYWAWRADPIGAGGEFAAASRRLRDAIRESASAGVTNAELGTALRMSAEAAGDWREVLIAPRGSAGRVMWTNARGGDDR